MKRSIGANFTLLCFCLVPTLSACAIKDIAGDVDAGAAGGAPGTGGASVLTGIGGAADVTTGGSSIIGTGGEVSATGGAIGTGGSKVAGGAASTIPSASVGGSTASPTTLPTWATADGCVVGNENSQFVGTWEGYIQGTPIGDEASSLRLNIVGANATGLCGTVTVGTHTAPVTLPVASDATANYPPGTAADQLKAHSFGPILGLAYTIQAGQTAGQRATFNIAYTEIYKGWCSLQTSYPQGATDKEYGCLPAFQSGVRSGDQCSIAFANGAQQQVACAQLYLCGIGTTCSCDPSTCTANPQAATTLFDLLFNGNQAMGMFGTANVVFNRSASCMASGLACNTDADCCSHLCAVSGDGGVACQ